MAWSVLREMNCRLLSAILLKQWRVPRTVRLFCFLADSRTLSWVRAEYRFSVLYSKLPAQFLSFSPAAHAKRGARKGLPIREEQTLRKDRLFIGAHSLDRIKDRIVRRHNPRKVSLTKAARRLQRPVFGKTSTGKCTG